MELMEDAWSWNPNEDKYKKIVRGGHRVTGGYDGKIEEQDEEPFSVLLCRISKKLIDNLAYYDYYSYKLVSPAFTEGGKKMQSDFTNFFKEKKYIEYKIGEKEIFGGDDVYHIMYYFNENSSNLNRKLRLFIGSNFYDMIGTFYLKDIECKNKENFMKFINDEIVPKYSEVVEKIYQVYINNYCNVNRYNIYTLCDMFRGNRILNTNVLELKHKYPNLKEDEILTMCLYKLDDEMFDRYLKLLNSKSDEEKEKIFEIIKPLSYYYQYLPSSSEVENFTEYEKRASFSAKTAEMIQEYLNTKDLEYSYKINRYSGYDNVDLSYYGKIYYISTFQNIFLNQLDVLGKMTNEQLDQLLQIKAIIVNNAQTVKVNCHEETYKLYERTDHEEYFNTATGSWDTRCYDASGYATREVYTMSDVKTEKTLSYLEKYFKTYAFENEEINNDVIREYIRIMINSVFLTMVPNKAKELIKKL